MTQRDETAFRKLREAWFNAHLKSNPHEREWEDETDAFIRNEDNVKTKRQFDEDTEAILRGEDRVIAPRCLADMGKHKGRDQ